MRILANLDSIQRLIHDFWFDLDLVRHDIQTGTVKVELGEDRKPPYHGCTITVTNVVKMSIADDAEIRFYDLNRIKVTANTVRLVSGFPLEILLAVSEGAELSVEDARGDCFYLPFPPM